MAAFLLLHYVGVNLGEMLHTPHSSTCQPKKKGSGVRSQAELPSKFQASLGNSVSPRSKTKWRVRRLWFAVMQARQETALSRLGDTHMLHGALEAEAGG